MKLIQTSGPAIFMYSIIALGIILTAVGFGVYYGGYSDNTIFLWTGITAFTITYHFWGRIILGNVSKLFRKHLNYNQGFFKERKFEKKLYKILKVKKWKGKALTYNPELFDLKENSLEQIANTMIKSEVDHWINEAISVSTMFFGLIWGQTWIFLITAIAAMIFDGQFIVIQRYNRPRVIKLIEKQQKNKESKKASKSVEML